MKIALGCDRNGLEYKQALIEHLKGKGINIIDVGTYDKTPCDFPIYAEKAARKVTSGECEYGILICNTGTGMAISANKVKGIRCGIGYDDNVAKFSREHCDANMIAFGQKFMNFEDVKRRTDIFLSSNFAGMHHTPRMQQIKDLEEGKKLVPTPVLNPNWNAEGSTK